MVSMKDLLTEMTKRGASDLHITIGSPPQLRIDGKLVRTPYEVITPDVSKRLAYSILTEKQKHKFEEEWEIDLSFGVEGIGRFRANVYLQRGCVAISIRMIPNKIQGFEELNLPPVVQNFSTLTKGLVLVTGPTGAGKTTTLAAIVGKINNERHLHILTVEDPIEYVHQHKNALVNQREL